MDYEHLYPETARRFLPHVDEVLQRHDGELTDAHLTRMTDDVMRRVGMDPRNSDPRGMDPRGGSAVNDFVRLLILQRALENGGFPVPFAPFFWPIVTRPPNRFFPNRR